jgi:hypothetical protein
MKRSIAASCALGLLSAPAAALETTVELDGHIGFSGSYFDSDVDDNTNLHNNASRIGLTAKVSEGGVTGFARYERGMDIYNPDSDFTGGLSGSESLGEDFVREVYAGIESDYGRITLGRFRAAYARAGKRVDPFYDTSIAGFSGTAGTLAGQGANYGLSNLSNGFSDRVVELQSGNYGGLTVNANVYADGSTNNDHDYGAGLSYAGELGPDMPFELGVQYLEIRNQAISGVPFNDDASVGGSPGESTNIRASGIVDLDVVSIGANYEYVDVDAESRERHYSTLTATMPLSAKLNLAAAVSYLDFPDDGPTIEGLGGSLGAFYEVLPGLSTYAAVRYIDFDDERNPTDDSLAVALGAGYSFDLSLR